MEPLIVFCKEEEYSNPSKEINQRVIDISRKTTEIHEEDENLKKLEIKLKEDTEYNQITESKGAQYQS